MIRDSVEWRRALHDVEMLWACLKMHGRFKDYYLELNTDKRLDVENGIDYWVVHYPTNARRPVTLRAQRNSPFHASYDTFTVRKTRWRADGSMHEHPQELEKSRARIRDNILRPEGHMQGYLDEHDGIRIRSIGWMHHDKLFEAIDKHEDELEVKENRLGTGDADFLVVPWHKLKEWGYDVHIFRPGETR